MAEIKFKPLGDYVLVKPGESETKTKSGLILTEDSADKPKWGTIVATGQGYFDPVSRQFMPLTVKKGDKVYWSYQGQEIELEGEKYFVMKESQLLGIEE